MKAKAGEPQEVEDLESPASPPSAVPLAGGLVGAVDDANLLAAAAAAAIGIAGAAAAAAGVQQGKTRANMRSRASAHFGADKGKCDIACSICSMDSFCHLYCF